jgi:hypothetical protein
MDKNIDHNHLVTDEQKGQFSDNSASPIFNHSSFEVLEIG